MSPCGCGALEYVAEAVRQVRAISSGLCKCLHTVSISASSPASPSHLVVGRFQFCQCYRLTSGADRRRGGQSKSRATLALCRGAVYLVSLHYLICKLTARCIVSVSESSTEKTQSQILGICFDFGKSALNSYSQPVTHDYSFTYNYIIWNDPICSIDQSISKLHINVTNSRLSNWARYAWQEKK